MGNQQETANSIEPVSVSELKKAWLAGMLNGDGCFSMSMRNKAGVKGKNRSIDLRLILTQTDPCIIEEASIIIEALTGGSAHIQEYERKNREGPPIMHLRVTRMAHIRIVGEAIMPYLVGTKRAKLTLMLRYIQRRMDKQGQSPRHKNIDTDGDSLIIFEQYKKLGGRGDHLAGSSTTNTQGAPDQE